MEENLQQWQRVKKIVGSALERPSTERAAYLDEVCSRDLELRREVESLLAAYQDTGDLSAAPWAVESHAREIETQFAGPYRLVKELGVGGMGQVWLAEQTEPVRRRVALKLIKAGMYDSSTVQRFKAERQSLATMDHPAIAKVFDAGTTSDGQPYLAMEYIDGLAITDCCDAKKLGIRERLQLFIRVCEGVQHAHQKAIIHRDLKPSNILVVEVDGNLMPRIIDFGLAKATESLVPGETLLTQMGAFLGTPGYMSPEQADPKACDIDTRTDVYSLGVVLYELLTGFLPFDTSEWEKQRPEESLRQLRDEDPPRPSTRISTNRVTSTSKAEARSTDVKQLARSLRGDLDWITMKALEKDRGRRYATPSELAGDIENYLGNKPVTARPASLGYRAQKYSRRHAPGVAVVAGMAALLITFAVMQAIELRRITRERDRADRITEFMTNMFKVSDPSESRGNTITAREILDKSSKEIDTGLAKDPELKAQMITVMGKVYERLGLFSRARSHLERGLEIRRSVLGPEHRDTLASAYLLAWDLDQLGRYPEAEKLERETLEVQRRVLGPENEDTLATMAALASTLDDEGHPSEAEKLGRETLTLQKSVLGSENVATLATMSRLGWTLRELGRYAESANLSRETLEIQRRVFGSDGPQTLSTMNSLASTLEDQAQYPEAEKLFRDALEIEVRVLGREHPSTLGTMNSLAGTLEHEGRYSESEKLDRETLEAKQRVLGPEHPDTFVTMNNLASVVQEQGRYVEAEELYTKLRETQARVLGPEHPYSLVALISLGFVLNKEGKASEAEKLLQHALISVRRVLGPEHPFTLQAMSNLADAMRSEGKCVEAEKLYRACVESQTKLLGAQNPATFEPMEGLGIALSCEKRFPEAQALYQSAIDSANKTGQPAVISELWNSFATAALVAGHRQSALLYLRRAVDNGYSQDKLQTDPDLKSLRNDPRFKAIVADVKRAPAAEKSK